MRKKLLDKGGPYNVRYTGDHQFDMSIPLPADDEGRTARQCPNSECSPGYFKVKADTGITEEQAVAYCPYCRLEAEPSEFTTPEQIRYGTEIMSQEVLKGADRMLKDMLGIGPSGRKKLSSGLFPIEMSVKTTPSARPRLPFEDEVQRNVTCPGCTLDHAVFGLAMWCYDCGSDIFMTHVEAEIDVVRAMLLDIERRREELGPRIAAKDVENCLEDAVSIYEAVLKALVMRYLEQEGKTEDEIQELLKKTVRNGFQNVERSAALIKEITGHDLYEDVEDVSIERLKSAFEMRHPITHNLGVVDRKYLERSLDAEREGREIRVAQSDIETTLMLCFSVLKSIHGRLFGGIEPIRRANASDE